MNLNLDTPHHACLSKMRRIMKENRIKASILIVKHDRKAERKEYISNNLFLTEDGYNSKPDNSNEIW